MPRKLNAMVAGGTGYIGSFLIELMRDDDTFENVFIIDSRFRPELLVGLPPKFHFIQMDIADVDVLRPLLKNIDVMFLLVAVVEAEKSAQRETFVMETNYDKCRDLIDACPASTRVVFASTGNVYGGISKNENWKNIDETIPPQAKLPYAISKVAVEKHLAAERKNFTVCRFGTNYGFAPGIRFNIVTNIFIRRALMGNDLVLHGGGLNFRPNVHVQDAARGMLHVGLLPEAEGEIYHIARQNMSIKELAETILKFAPQVNLLTEEREVPFNSYALSSEKLLATGFEFNWDLESGVEDMFKRFQCLSSPIDL